MSFFDFRPKPKGNLEHGGIVRAPGEKELGPKTKPKLEIPAEFEVLFTKDDEIHRENELKAVEKVLLETKFFDTTWKAKEVLKLPKIKKDLAEKLGWGFHPERLEGYLETLAAQGK